MNKNKIISVMNLIIEDTEQDVHDYENAPFTGKTVGELHGILEAKIRALATAVKALAELLKDE